MAIPAREFLAGVIEGFYGAPWSPAERLELFDRMAAWGMNTYFYGPKDDLKHRALWREPYSPRETEALGEMIRACRERNLRFIYGLSPGLDIRYHDNAERIHLRSRFDQMIELGCQHFALGFDDIPDRMDPEDRKRWGSFASAQCHLANELFRWTAERCPDARFLFCPTAYCGRMRERQLGGSDYLPTLGRELLPEIDIFWTGPEIISTEITVAHIRELQTVLRRKPVIWDNLHANDYDGHRFYCGPYAGRPLELRPEVSGLLINPNNEFALNFIPLRTLARFLRCPAASRWEPRAAYLSAMREWLPHFDIAGEPLNIEDLVLFGDCYYLPHQQGPEAEALYERVRGLFATNPVNWKQEAAAIRNQLARLRTFCARLAELRERPLFYALSRRAWELREELDLLDRYVEFQSGRNPTGPGFTSDFHLPDTYRGGIVPQLQRLLRQHSDGTFTPATAAETRQTTH